MHHSLKYGLAAAAGVAALEYVYTTSWYQSSSLSQPGGAGGIVTDMAIAGIVAVGVGMLLH